MKKISNICIQATLTLMVLFSLATTVYAVNPDYTVLVPLPGTTKSCGAGANGVTTCTTNWNTYLQGAFKLSIGIAAGMAFVMITFGGIIYATSDAITGKSQGKEYIENALWGLLLVIGAWVILNTINPNILNFNLNIDKPTITYGQATITPGVAMLADNIAADTAAKKALADLGVTVNNNGKPCLDGATHGCTNANGLAATTITGVGFLKSSCDTVSGTKCEVQVTGGTEPGHTPNSCHNNGSGNCVDIGANQTLNTFLGFPNPNGNAGGKTPSKATVGNCTYTYEETGDNGAATGVHWHAVCN